jgi:predicted transcriptional regulator
MPSSTTLTVRLPGRIKDQLGRLAKQTNRTKSYLAGDAIADYVKRELDIVEGVKRGIEDMKAGRVVPHAEAMRRLRRTAERAAKRAKRRA